VVGDHAVWIWLAGLLIVAAFRLETAKVARNRFNTMKRNYCLLLLIWVVGCHSPAPTNLPADTVAESKNLPVAMPPDSSQQISQYIRRVFEDSKGNLWFGTNGDGVCRKYRTSLTYFSTNEGFAGQAVRGIVEDAQGDIWFGTDGGVSRYDGLKFTNYTTSDGLSNNDVWSIFRDHEGRIWVGTKGGLCRYDPASPPGSSSKIFTQFPLPAADIAEANSIFSPQLVWAIAEDKLGNMWFGTDGVGVRKYDGKTFTILTAKDGLAGNNVSCILADRAGNIWFGTQEAGLSRYDGHSFTTFTETDGLCYNFVWTLIEDKAENIWIGTAGGSCCRYDGKSFTSFSASDGLLNRHVQSIFQAKNGKLWLGTSGGLFRLEGNAFVNVTKEGPW
jgi:ligand-binding sensor domain-containing protein